MAAITAAAVVAAGTAYAAKTSSDAAKGAARTQRRAADAATAEQARQFDLSMEMTRPRREVETQALNALASLTGLRGAQPGGRTFDNSGTGQEIDPNTGQPIGVQVGPNGAPDYSQFFMSPDYQFALEQGMQATERSAAARGGLRSGNTLAALTRYGSGLATQNFNNYIGRLQSLAGMGADQAGANMSVAFGDRVANNLISAGNAQAAGQVGAANARASGVNQLAQLGGYALQQWGSAPKTSPMIRGANSTYQQPPTGYYGSNNLMRVA